MALKNRIGSKSRRITFSILAVILLACHSLCSSKRSVGMILELTKTLSETFSSSASVAANIRGSKKTFASYAALPPKRRRVSKNTTFIELPLPNASLPPISITACCGIGHRLSRNIPAMVYAISNSRLVVPDWGSPRDHNVPWDILFNDTEQIKKGREAKELYSNELPEKWDSSPLAYTKPLTAPERFRRTTYGVYDDFTRTMFEMPLAHSIIKSLSDNLSSMVLSFLEPMRKQYLESELHVCVHLREGNNETGDWEGKTWRHIHLMSILNTTLSAMKSFAGTEHATKVSVFVASDSTKARPWFEKNVPASWRVVKPGKEVPRPENGVWFGEHNSTTNKKLNLTDLNEAMSEAVADVFALGECDALYIPNYSSFSIVGISLTRAEGNKVFFLTAQKDEYIQYP